MTPSFRTIHLFMCAMLPREVLQMANLGMKHFHFFCFYTPIESFVLCMKSLSVCNTYEMFIQKYSSSGLLINASKF